ncbi:GTP-binding protein [Candidatus Woesearchaeota archaeon]|nr:GTP-binding protein [Candidatus Woesearchaeota archaeon]
MKISTGIDILDRELTGGIKQGSSVLIMATPGVEDLQFAHQSLFSYLINKGNATYMVNNKKPSIVREMLKGFDWDISRFEKQGSCVFMDSYSGLIKALPEAKGFVKDPTDIDQVSEAAYSLLNKTKTPALIVIDSLSSMIDVTNSEKEVIKFLKKFTSKAKESGITIIALFTQWPYSKSTIKGVEKVFDCIIRLKAVEQKVILRSYFSVEKASWLEKKEKHEIPYKILNPGGVKVFIPKILVTGPFNAGKTSFIHSASTKAISVDRLGTTVALDHGHVEFKGFAVDLFGTPGQERFDPMLDLLSGEAFGVIIIVDATKPKGFARAKEMLKRTRKDGLPAVIAVNKIDLEGALGLAEVSRMMSMPEDILLVPMRAENAANAKEGKPCKLKKEDVNNVLEKLLEKVI